MKKITMKDIAEKAGVSKATVSRVINKTKPVSLEVKERVEKIIEENNYKPSAVARSLANRETKVIGLIIPDLSNAFYAELVRGISRTAHSKGYNVFLCNTFKDQELEMEFLELLDEKEVDAIILTTFHTTEVQKDFIKKFKKPVVTVNRNFEGENLPIVSNIDIDNYKASYEAVKYLIDINHKKIGVIRAEKEDETCVERLEGYKDALRDNQIECDKKYIIESDFHFKSAYSGMMKILKYDEVPDAMFCFSDELAMGAIRAIIDFGLNVPNDISIIGFDDIPMAKRFIPSITTIKQPIFKMGKVAMETLYGMIIDKEKISEKNIILDYELVIRDSTIIRN
ncbi:MAG: LacI family DNA-binding transcriptional regulator [Bacillota bacterium]|nr:LacI family DNA-binding transcriptional regulator [Bacillota bacterium]